MGRHRASAVSGSPPALMALVERFDPEVMELPGGPARIRLEVRGDGAWDAIVDGAGARLARPGGSPDAVLSADADTWKAVARDLRGGMQAFGAGRLSVRRNLHLGVGLLAATSGMREPGRLEFRRAQTRAGSLSYLQAGTGPAVAVALHGLGATKISMLPTVAALAADMRVISVDLPGFGDSAKPLAAPYDARFFARATVALLDALELERAHVIGNSMGGRAALETGLRHPERVDRLVLLAPSMAWRRERAWAPLLRLVRPELGLVQLAPRAPVEGLVRRLVPGGSDGWSAAGVDEFLRSYLTARGRAAFYAAARQIYLEEPHGENGFWPRLCTLEPESLFVWGRQDTLVPLAFARHVTDALPSARHVELDCGHVPQLEAPEQTHAAVRDFLLSAPVAGGSHSRR